MYNIVGLDLSLTATGLVVLNDRHEILDQTLIVSTNKEENTPRLVNITNKIMKKVNAFKPQLVVIEGPAFGIQKTQSIFTLGELAGILKAKLYAELFPFRLVAPTALKKWVTGKGNSKKDLMLLAVYKKFGVEFTDDNLCDAYVLARYGFQFINPVLKRRNK